MRRIFAICGFLSLVAATGCQFGGAFQPTPGDDDDVAAAPDAGPDPLKIRVDGLVRDFESTDALASAALASEGLTPPITTASDALGTFSLIDLEIGSTFHLRTSPVANYRVTLGTPITTVGLAPGTVVTQDQLAVSTIYAQRQHSTMGLPVVAGQAIVIVELQNGQGLPKEGVPLADLTLTDVALAPVGSGPYFIGPLGDVDAAVITSTAVAGHAYVVWLSVPAGTHTMSALYEIGGTPITTSIVAEPDGATLGVVRGGGMGM